MAKYEFHLQVTIRGKTQPEEPVWEEGQLLLRVEANNKRQAADVLTRALQEMVDKAAATSA